MFWFRLVPDNVRFAFMKGRFIGLASSAFLSIASVILFFHPGLNYGVDFKGGIAIEIRTDVPVDFEKLRTDLNGLGVGQVQLQQFGSPNDVLIRMEAQPDGAAQQAAVKTVSDTLVHDFPGTTIRVLNAGEKSYSTGHSLVNLGLRVLEAAGLQLPFRSDSLVSMLYGNPAPGLATEVLGVPLRPLDALTLSE